MGFFFMRQSPSTEVRQQCHDVLGSGGWCPMAAVLMPAVTESQGRHAAGCFSCVSDRQMCRQASMAHQQVWLQALLEAWQARMTAAKPEEQGLAFGHALRGDMAKALDVAVLPMAGFPTPTQALADGRAASGVHEVLLTPFSSPLSVHVSVSVSQHCGCTTAVLPMAGSSMPAQALEHAGGAAGNHQVHLRPMQLTDQPSNAAHRCIEGVSTLEPPLHSARPQQTAEMWLCCPWQAVQCPCNCWQTKCHGCQAGLSLHWDRTA